MKKLICLALALMLAVCLIPALGEEAGEYIEPSPLGDWYADLDGLAVQLTLNEDGTCFFTAMGKVSEPDAWTLEDGFLYLAAAEDTVLSFNGEPLCTENGEMFFTREAPKPRYTLAPPWENTPGYYYEGLWLCVFVELGGSPVPAELLAEDSVLWIETEVGDEGMVEGPPEEITYGDAVAILGGARFGDVIESFVYQDGAYIGKLTETGAAVTLQLLGDEILKVTVETAEETETLYFERDYLLDLEDVEE